MHMYNNLMNLYIYLVYSISLLSLLCRRKLLSNSLRLPWGVRVTPQVMYILTSSTTYVTNKLRVFLLTLPRVHTCMTF